MTGKLGLIGRDRTLINKLARALLTADRGTRHEYTDPVETARGARFDVRIFDPDGKPTGHIARVTVELDRVDQTGYEAEKGGR